MQPIPATRVEIETPRPMTTTQRLKDLLGRATPGPWIHFYFRPDVPQDEVVLELLPIMSGVGPNVAPNRVMIMGRQTDEHIDDDAELIAESRNALPALLAVVEAADQVVRDMDSWDAAVSNVIDFSRVPKWESKEVLRKALAALNTEKTNG